MIYTIIITIGAAAVVALLWYKNKALAETLGKNSDLLKEKDERYSTLLSQKKSSEIILGQVTEKLVPFLDEFKHDPQQASFLGNPIDYVVFGKDKITFVEVKSGNAKLTAKQRAIKKLIEDKKVFWEQLNIKPEKKK